jgi:hypothetical protein
VYHSNQTSSYRVSLSYFAGDGRSVGRSVGQSVSQSVSQVSQSLSQSVHLGVEPLWDSLPDFGCSQDNCGFIFSWGILPDERTGLSSNTSQFLIVGSTSLCAMSLFYWSHTKGGAYIEGVIE